MSKEGGAPSDNDKKPLLRAKDTPLGRAHNEGQGKKEFEKLLDSPPNIAKASSGEQLLGEYIAWLMMLLLAAMAALGQKAKEESAKKDLKNMEPMLKQMAHLVDKRNALQEEIKQYKQAHPMYVVDSSRESRIVKEMKLKLDSYNGGLKEYEDHIKQIVETKAQRNIENLEMAIEQKQKAQDSIANEAALGNSLQNQAQEINDTIKANNLKIAELKVGALPDKFSQISALQNENANLHKQLNRVNQELKESNSNLKEANHALARAEGNMNHAQSKTEKLNEQQQRIGAGTKGPEIGVSLESNKPSKDVTEQALDSTSRVFTVSAPQDKKETTVKPKDPSESNDQKKRDSAKLHR